MNVQPGICISLLGRFCLYIGNQEVAEAAFTSRKALHLLKLLAITPNHRLHRDQAMEALWPGLEPAAAAAQMYKSIHYIRKAFSTTNENCAADALLVYHDEVMNLTAPASVHTDVEAFRHLAHEARQTRALPSYQRAIACYAGDLLPSDIYERWSEDLREALREQFVELLIELGQKYLEAGEFADAAETFRRVLTIDSLYEIAHQGLMRAFALQGSRSQALHQYKRCEEIVWRELEAKPSAGTIALFKEIRDGKIQPAAKAAPKKVTATQPTQALHQRSPLIGRQDELKRVAIFLDTLAEGRGAVLMLQGAAGIGKTRFVQEIFNHGQLRGYHVLAGSAYEQENALPYNPIIEALRAAIRLSPDLASLIPAELAAGIPELSSVPPQPVHADFDASQSYLFAGVARVLKALAERAPVVMILEDLHFADDGTLNLFGYLARNASAFPLLLVGTCRADEADTSSALTGLLAAMERSGLATTLALHPLSPAEHQQLLAQSFGHGEVDERLANEVYSLTEGNPLFAVEMAAQLMKAGEITLQEGVWRPGQLDKTYLPPSLQILLAQKWNRLSSKAQSLSNMVAVAGQQSDLQLLESILQSSSAEILDSLDETLAVRLLRESGLAFRFVHPLFHEAVYQQMSQTRQRYLHGQVAQALEAMHREDPAPVLEALADHYLKSDRPALALPYLIKAGERAAALYAHETAIRYFQQALQMDDGSHLVQLHECLGDQSGMLGNEQKSAAHYEAALAALTGRAGNAADQRPLHRKAAYRYTLAGDLENASRYLDAAEHFTPEARDLEWVRLQYVLAHYHWQKNEFVEALAIAHASLLVAEALGAEADAAKAYEIMALCCVPMGEWRQGLHYEARRLSLADLNRYLADVSDVHL